MLVVRHLRQPGRFPASCRWECIVCLNQKPATHLVWAKSNCSRSISSDAPSPTNDGTNLPRPPYQGTQQTLAAIQEEIKQNAEHVEEQWKEKPRGQTALRDMSQDGLQKPYIAMQNSVDAVAKKANNSKRCSGYGWTVAAPYGYKRFRKSYFYSATPLPLLKPFKKPLLVVLMSKGMTKGTLFAETMAREIRNKVYPKNSPPPKIQLLLVGVERVSIPSGIPSTLIWREALSKGAEGYSFFWTSLDKLTYTDREAQSPRLSGEANKTGSLVVRLNAAIPRKSDGSGETVEFKVNLANTTFENGRARTMCLQGIRPRRPKDDKQRKPVSPTNDEIVRNGQVQHLDDQDVYLDIDGVHELPSVQAYDIPARTRLTSWRSVVDVSGNVIKKIEGDDGPIPASMELEAVMTQTPPSEHGSFEIWAEIASNEQHLDDSANPASSEQSSFIRVVGGGGGWGDKKGLIALDPASVPDMDNLDALNFDNMFPNCCSVGDKLRFLKVNLEDVRLTALVTRRHTSSHLGHAIESNGYTNFGFGTTGMTDDGQAQASDIDERKLAQSPVLYGHFGAMSTRMHYRSLLINHSSDANVSAKSVYSTELPPFTHFNANTSQHAVVHVPRISFNVPVKQPVPSTRRVFWKVPV